MFVELNSAWENAPAVVLFLHQTLRGVERCVLQGVRVPRV